MNSEMQSCNRCIVDDNSCYKEIDCATYGKCAGAYINDNFLYGYAELCFWNENMAGEHGSGYIEINFCPWCGRKL